MQLFKAWITQTSYKWKKKVVAAALPDLVRPGTYVRWRWLMIASCTTNVTHFYIVVFQHFHCNCDMWPGSVRCKSYKDRQDKYVGGARHWIYFLSVFKSKKITNIIYWSQCGVNHSKIITPGPKVWCAVISCQSAWIWVSKGLNGNYWCGC